VNTNLWKYALPLLATAVAATVGIWMRPPTAAKPELTTRQTIANSRRDSAAVQSSSNECLDAAREPSPVRPHRLEDLLQGCDDENP